MQSVELLLEAAAEDRAADVWQRLLDAGMPSQARHRSPSNRPHVTLVALPALPEGAEPLLADAASLALPVTGSWGAVTTFGRGPWTVVWLVEPSPAMRRLQARVAEVCAVPEDHLTAAAHWTPHLTLARRVREPELADVLRLVEEPVAQAARKPVVATAVRRWDGSARVEWLLAATSRTRQP